MGVDQQVAEASVVPVDVSRGDSDPDDRPAVAGQGLSRGRIAAVVVTMALLFAGLSLVGAAVAVRLFGGERTGTTSTVLMAVGSSATTCLATWMATPSLVRFLGRGPDYRSSADS